MENIHITRQQPNVTVSEPRPEYHLPVATESTLGGIKVGNNLAITEDGVLSAYPSEYDLPVASSNTLGGIKVGDKLTIQDGVLSVTVDATLSSQSTNPVANSTLTSALNALDTAVTELDDRLDTDEDNISTLSSTVASHTSSISGFSDDISALQSTVADNTDAISTNATNIGTVSGNLGQLSSTVTTLSGTVTDQGNALNAVVGEINDLIINTDTDVEYSYLLPVNTWSAGTITYSQRGKLVVLQFDLTGTYDLQSQVLSQIYQLPSAIQNSIPCYGTLITDAGAIEVTVDIDRNIKFYNHDNSTMHITKVKGQLTIVLQ